jgi:hypothetical protein
MPKPQVRKIAQIVAGLGVAAGLIYFLHGLKSSPLVDGLVVLAMLFFARLVTSRVYDENPTAAGQVVPRSRKLLRDFGLAVACFVATIAVILGILTGIDHNLLPDNKVTEGMLWVVVIAGIAGVMWFMSGIVTRVVYGPPLPPEN